MLLKMEKIWKRAAKVLCAFALAASVVSVVGCSQPTSLENAPEQPTPSGYMTSVNAVSEELSATLSEFAEAAAARDVFTMQAKADAAYGILAKIADLEAPEELSEVKAKYGSAIDSLKEGLDEYIQLFSELDDAQAGAGFDFDGYSDRIEQIQKKYDAGLNLLEEADSAAAQK